MSYSPIHNYRQRDRLPPNDPDKIIYGSHLSDDFEAIAGALRVIESEVEKIEVGPEADIAGLVEEAPIDGVVYARSNANWVPVQSDTGEQPPSSTSWDDVADKPDSISALGYNNVIDGGTYGTAP